MLARISRLNLTSKFLQKISLQVGYATERSIDPYTVLGIGRDATQSQIKKAYFDLAKQYHPDTAKGDSQTTQKFHQIQAAYELLGDPQKRAQFDQGIRSDEQCGPNGFSSSTPGSTFYNSNDADPFANIFGDIFSQFTQRSSSRVDWDQSDLDVSVGISLSFQEAVRGTNRTVSYSRNEPCQCCTGSGIKPGSTKSTCLGCKGTGQFKRRMQGLFFSQTCHECRGSGYQFTACQECAGRGIKEQKNTLQISIPAGVQPNDVIQQAGLGHWVNGYPRGNLNIRISSIASSDQFERKKNDIYTTVKIPLHQAILGGSLKVPTIWGDVEMSLADSLPLQPGSVRRLRGKGIQNGIDGCIGDQLVRLEVAIPTRLTDKQKQLLTEFAQQLQGKPH